jgi:hypothetical protein
MAVTDDQKYNKKRHKILIRKGSTPADAANAILKGMGNESLAWATSVSVAMVNRVMGAQQNKVPQLSGSAQPVIMPQPKDEN